MGLGVDPELLEVMELIDVRRSEVGKGYEVGGKVECVGEFGFEDDDDGSCSVGLLAPPFPNPRGDPPL